MKCPYCGSNQLVVTNSRPTRKGSSVWRRRKCLNCKDTFTTYERINLSQLIVIKKSGRKQKFNRAKLYSGIYHSTIDKKDADRGDMGQLSEDITRMVEQRITGLKKKKIHTQEIMDIVMDTLVKKAPDAFFRFVAYKEGNDRKRLRKFVKRHY